MASELGREVRECCSGDRRGSCFGKEGVITVSDLPENPVK